jgi:hypothetical protein
MHLCLVKRPCSNESPLRVICFIVWMTCCSPRCAAKRRQAWSLRSSPVTTHPSAALHMQSGHAALLGALRREAAAAAAGRRAGAEAERLLGLLRQRDMDAQRAKMILRLKEDRIARLQARRMQHARWVGAAQ